MHPRLKRDSHIECLIIRHRIYQAIAQIHSAKALEGIAQRAEKDLEIIQGKRGDRAKSRAKQAGEEIAASDTIWRD